MNMPADGKQIDFREHGLTFFGTITASVTHELNNVMGIIEQTAGLLDDLCVGVDYGRPIEIEKLREISGRVVMQVDRGVDIIKRLNFFAHSVDESVREFELNALLKNLVSLAQRFATLKKISLEGRFNDFEHTVKTNPFILEQVVFICIQLAITPTEKDSRVILTSQQESTGSVILITGPPVPENDETKSKMELLRALMGLIKGDIELTAEDDRIYFKLTVPNISNEE